MCAGGAKSCNKMAIFMGKLDKHLPQHFFYFDGGFEIIRGVQCNKMVIIIRTRKLFENACTQLFQREAE